MTTLPTAVRWIIAAVLALVAVAALAWWFLTPREGTQQLEFTQAYGLSDSVTLEIGVGSCLRPVTVDVEETLTEVHLAASIDMNPAEGCPDILEFVPVELRRPLGDRAVIDASTGREATLADPRDA